MTRRLGESVKKRLPSASAAGPSVNLQPPATFSGRAPGGMMSAPALTPAPPAEIPSPSSRKENAPARVIAVPPLMAVPLLWKHTLAPFLRRSDSGRAGGGEQGKK